VLTEHGSLARAELSPGTNGTLQSTAYTGAESCAAAACHGGLAAERITDSADPSIVASGTWATGVATSWYGGSAVRTNVYGARLTMTFTGNQVSIWGYTGTYGSTYRVYVDGRLIATRTQYESGSHANNGVFTSDDLGPGTHTLAIENSGTNTATR
jgi:hypothetical protein